MTTDHQKTSWRHAWLSEKASLFSALVKLRLNKSPADVLESVFETSSENSSSVRQSYFDLYEDCLQIEAVKKKFESLIEYLSDELYDSSRLLLMAEGYVLSAQTDTYQPMDVNCFMDANYLGTCRQRFASALGYMLILASSHVLRPFCQGCWPNALRLAESVFKLAAPDSMNSQRSDRGCAADDFQKIVSLLELEKEMQEQEPAALEKFRSNNDLYILCNGLPGYNDALQKVLSQIGGREWNMPLLEVLEQRAGMIETFDQMKQLIDVLPAARSMVDMRIQKCLGNIFKTAFNNLAFSIKKQTMNYYFQKYGLLNSSDIYADYVTELNLIINNLVECIPKGQVRQMAVRLSWHFMLSAKNCWWRILSGVLAMPKLSHVLVEVLKFLPVITSLKVPEDGDLLIFAGLKRALEQNVLLNDENQFAWIELCVNMCTGFPKKPLYEPAPLIRQLLLPLLPKFPNTALVCLNRILQDKSAKIMFQPALPCSFPKDQSKKIDETSEEKSPIVDKSAIEQTVDEMTDQPMGNTKSDSVSEANEKHAKMLSESENRDETENRIVEPPSDARDDKDLKSARANNDKDIRIKIAHKDSSKRDSLSEANEVHAETLTESENRDETENGIKDLPSDVRDDVDFRSTNENNADQLIEDDAPKCADSDAGPLTESVESSTLSKEKTKKKIAPSTEYQDILEPLIVFDAIFSIYVRASKQKHACTPMNEDRLNLCRKCLVALTKRWRMGNADDDRPVVLDLQKVDDFRTRYAALPWSLVLFADWLLYDFCKPESIIIKNETADSNDTENAVSDAETTKGRWIIYNVAGCLFDYFSLSSSRYNRLDCCEIEVVDETSANKERKSQAACALASLIELAVISTDLSLAVLNDAGSLKNFTTLKSDNLRKCSLYAVKTHLEGKTLDDFRSVGLVLDRFFEMFNQSYNKEKTFIEPKKNGATMTVSSHIERGYTDGLRLVAPVIMYADIAMLLLSENENIADGGGSRQKLVNRWLSYLYSMISESCSRLTTMAMSPTCDFDGRFAVMTSLRQLWTACTLLLDKMSVSDQKPIAPRPIDFLFISVLEAFQRAQLEFDKSLLRIVSVKLNDQVLGVLEKKLPDCRLSNADS